MPVTDEYSQLFSEPKPVADNAMKISKNVETGEISLQTGAKADPEMLEEFRKVIQNRAKNCEDEENAELEGQ